MALTPQEIEAAPKIRLGDADYSIPLLVPRQQRVIIPKLMELFKAVAAGGGMDMKNFSTQQFDDIYIIVHAALTRALPLLTFNDFLDLTMSPADLIRSLEVIGRQTGIIGYAAKSGDVSSGEAQAGNSQTGTQSSHE